MAYRHSARKREKYNTDTQYYKGIPLRLIVYTEQHFSRLKAKRFLIGTSNQNVWIPNSCLADDGSILPNKNLDFVFRNAARKLELAGVANPYATKS